MNTYKPAPDVQTITSNFPIPGFGYVPINAFVIKGAEPVLVDTGAMIEGAQFMAALRSVIDPAELKWIWLTHPDADHTGCLHRLLAENPRLRVVTSFLGVGIMSLSAPLPLERVHLVNPGEALVLADRKLTAFKPPAFDNPSTTGFFDSRSRILYSSDCFGALLATPAQDAAELSAKALREAQTLWTTIDSPWLHKADRGVLMKELDVIRRMEPAMILSSHLPAAGAKLIDRLLATLADVPSAAPFVGPNQAALEHMLEEMTEGQPS
jgi:flavorubredoxin